MVTRGYAESKEQHQWVCKLFNQEDTETCLLNDWRWNV